MLHGGLLAVLLDECMGRASFSRLPNQVSVTASLQISFKTPIKLPSTVLIEAKCEEFEGRKAHIRGVVKSVGDEGLVLAEASALFIEPKGAETMTKLL
ncbi:hypothetical protein DL98DRAFT_460609 [Cadophora sp. DSE1049]|nr:hypothetical protein DL98DRAFT_460609 [Cadophora sp. DSE1049]